MKKAGKSDFNGNPETENSSEIADAIETIINNKVNPVKGDLTTLSTDVSSNYLNKNSTEQIVNSTVRCKNQVVLEARKFFYGYTEFKTSAEVVVNSDSTWTFKAMPTYNDDPFITAKTVRQEYLSKTGGIVSGHVSFRQGLVADGLILAKGGLSSESDVIATTYIKSKGHLIVDSYADIKKELTVGGYGDITGYLNVGGDLTAKSNATVEKNLTVQGITTLNSKLTVNNYAKITKQTTFDETIFGHGQLQIDDVIFSKKGIKTLNNGYLAIEGYATIGYFLIVEGNLTAKSNATVEGDLTAQGGIVGGYGDITGNLYVGGYGDITDNLYVGGNLTAKSDATVEGDLTVESNATVEGNLTAKSNATVEGDLTAQGEIKAFRIAVSKPIDFYFTTKENNLNRFKGYKVGDYAGASTSKYSFATDDLATYTEAGTSDNVNDDYFIKIENLSDVVSENTYIFLIKGKDLGQYIGMKKDLIKDHE